MKQYLSSSIYLHDMHKDNFTFFLELLTLKQASVQHKIDVSKQEKKGLHPWPSCEDHQ